MLIFSTTSGSQTCLLLFPASPPRDRVLSFPKLCLSRAPSPSYITRGGNLPAPAPLQVLGKPSPGKFSHLLCLRNVSLPPLLSESSSLHPLDGLPSSKHRISLLVSPRQILLNDIKIYGKICVAFPLKLKCCFFCVYKECILIFRKSSNS